MGILNLLGLGWVAKEIVKDSCIKPAAKGTDYRQATIDLAKGVDPKTVDKRISNGYYVKNKDILIFVYILHIIMVDRKLSSGEFLPISGRF